MRLSPKTVIRLLVCCVGVFVLCGCQPVSVDPVTITMASGVGREYEILLQQVAQFEAAHPQINVEVLELFEDTAMRYEFFVQNLEDQNSTIDIFMMDIIWPPEFGSHGWTVPLDDYVAEQGIVMQDFLPGSVAANSWEGKLVSMPWFTDAGLLYYRKDLLQAYGAAVPETWAELLETGRMIMDAEREHTPEMVGFVYQAAAYEGLVCNYLEYVRGNGAQVLDESGTQVLLDTPEAVEALEIFASMGQIAPLGINNFIENDALNYFLSGNAVFMRNWPYAWSLLNAEDSVVRGKVGVVALPHGPQGRVGVSTIGGWQLGVSAYSQHPQEAFEFVAFLTSLEQQKYKAIHAAQNPTRRAAYQDAEILAANPFMGELFDVFANAKPRPVHPQYTGDISPIIQTEVHSVLRGEKDAQTATRDMAHQIQVVIAE